MKKYLGKLFFMAAIMAVITSSCESKNERRERRWTISPNVSNEAMVDEYIESLANDCDIDDSYIIHK